MSLGQKTVRGILWAYTGFAGEKLLGFLVTVVLARLLFPEDFGVLAFALLLLGFVDTLRDLGIKDALIYTPDDIDAAADTALVMNVAIGLLQSAVVLLLAPFATHLIDDPRIVDLLQILSLTFLINALGATPDGLLQKRLNFRSRYAGDLAGALVKAVVTLGAVALGFGLAGVAIGHVAGATTRTVSRWLAEAWRPRFRFHRDLAWRLWQYGAHILSVNIMSAITMRADQLAIVLLIGQVQLAYYYLAARVSEMLLDNFSRILTRVLFPALSSVKGSRRQLKLGFWASTKYTALVIVPASLGLMVVAPDLVVVVLGWKWTPSIPLLQVLALAGLAASLAWSAGDLFKAMGRPDLQTKINLANLLLGVPLVFAATKITGQPVAAALTFVAMWAASAAARMWLARRLLRFAWRRYVPLYRTALLGGLTVAATAALCRMALAQQPPLASLTVSFAAGVLVYVPILWRFEREEILRLRATLRALFQRRAGRSVATEPAVREPSP